MDYFDTAKKYRLKSLYRIRSWIIRVLILILVAVFFWQIGIRDRNLTIAKHTSEMRLMEDEVIKLNQSLEKLKTQNQNSLKEIKRLKFELSAKPNSELGEILTLAAKTLSDGVSLEQLRSSIRKLKIPRDCRKYGNKDIAVDTPIYSGALKEVKFLDNGFGIVAEGTADNSLDNVNPWFDVKKPVRIRLRYFGLEDWVLVNLPSSIKLIIENKIILIDFSVSEIRGSISTDVSVCS